MKNLALLFTFSLSLSTLSAAALPQKWDVDLSAQPPQVFALQRPRGETYELEAVLKDHGKPFEPSITSARIYWQTNGMENLYWSAPASVSNNVLRATWLPSMDPGATTVRGYIGDPGHIYAAAFQFRFIASPGATPNELPLPQKVIDFAKVTVLNPPWQGGGGVSPPDTNAVIDIIHNTVDGSARTTPKYLWIYDCADSYPDDATWYYSQPQDYGHCSAVRDGGFLYRNYDWKFDSASEFVVRMAAGPGRFASVGVANCGTNLTEEIVSSGKPSRYFKCLPGRTVDGINEHGVCAEVNVVGGDPHESGWPTNGTIHCLGAVRWVLDHATNAASAASVLASEVYFPSGWKQNFHWMIADETSTYIVENGDAHPVTGATGVPPVGASSPGATGVPPVAVLTNFRLYPSRSPTGEGQERYDALVSGSSITSQWWTLTYTPDGYRASDLPGITGESLTQLFNYWENNPRESHRGETFGDQTWWQTVHTSVYDLTNRTLRICVQENPDWYTFSVPPSGATGVSPVAVREIVEPMIGDATNDLSKTLNDYISNKRDKTDLDVMANRISEWSFSGGAEGVDGLSVKITYNDANDTYDYELMKDRRSVAGTVMPTSNETYVVFLGYMPDVFDREPIASRTNETVVIDRLATTNGVNAAIADNERIGENNQIVRAFLEGSDEMTWSEKLWYLHVSLADTAFDLDDDYWIDARHPTTIEGYGITDAATKTELAAKRDLTDNVCRKAEGFTEFVWVSDAPNAPEGWPHGDSSQPVFKNGHWNIPMVGGDHIPEYEKVDGSEDDVVVSVNFYVAQGDMELFAATATRTSVCTSNELFVTQSFVTNAVNAAKYVPSATDPTFSNAVISVQIDTNTVAQIGELKQFFDDLPTGTVGTTLGGIILALLGAAAYLKKKTALLETDGKASDTFATDLLGKPVAKEAVNDLIEDKIEDSTTSTSTTNALSANMGKELQDQIQNLKQRGRYLSIWNCTTGLAETEPTVNPYPYKAGDYFIVGTVGATNYRPNGTQYDKNTASTTPETATVLTNDTYYYDGTSWSLLHTPMPPVPTEYLKSATATDNSITVTKQDNTQVSLTVNYEYAVGAFGSSIASGEIRTIAPITLTVPVTLNLGNSATESADCALWVDTSNLASDVTLSLSSNYNYFGDTGYQTMTKGKHILVTFLRLNATDVIVTKKEY